MTQRPDLRITAALSADIAARPEQVRATIALLDEGATVPFIARYRKEITGGLDDGQLRLLAERLSYLREMEARRTTIQQSIEAQGKMTEALQEKLSAATSKAELEDIYLPFKPKRRTRAQIARENGLEPLANKILMARDQEPAQLAQDFLNEKVTDIKTALEGARDILAEMMAENADLVGALRIHMREKAMLRSQVIGGKQEMGAKFSDYFDHIERLSQVPGHRALAMLRGRNEEILTLDVELDTDHIGPLKPVEVMIAKAYDIKTGADALAGDNFLMQVVGWAWRVKLSLSLSLDVMREMRVRAEQEAIKIFARNLKDLLLAAPAGAKITMGLDPGIRTGVKVAVVDETGKLLDTATVYPFQPKNDMHGAQAVLMALIARHHVALIAIGNGTASRETERLVADMLKNIPAPKPTKVIVSEAGASVYSASELAAREFPALDVSLRGAVSIARRLQDPLAELVKIEPKSIGVGQYQHDVDQMALARALDSVVEDAVNGVGVELNTASAPLLAHISGLSKPLAENIIAYRDEHGAFRSRQDLLRVPRLGAKAFEQCAGFLRINGGVEPLDACAVHPEAYPLARQIIAACGGDLRKIMSDPSPLKKLDLRHFINEQFGLPTIRDIMSELEKPGRDPRPEFKTATFQEGIDGIKDLKPGQILEGTVTNVAAFGAFVDIGVHQDGLVHISALADRFVKDPHEVVKAGDIVQVRVIEVDVGRKRIALSMRKDDAPGPTATNTDHQKNRRGKMRTQGGSSDALKSQQRDETSAFATALADALRQKMR